MKTKEAAFSAQYLFRWTCLKLGKHNYVCNGRVVKHTYGSRF